MLYFDEFEGHIPLLTYPNDSMKNNFKDMRPINIHPIWYLDAKIKSPSDCIKLIYRGKIYFAKKFLATSKRKKRRSGLKTDTPETIVIVATLPSEIEIFGNDLLIKITEIIIENFYNSLYQLIEAEIAMKGKIKSPKIEEIIKKGKLLKGEIKELIKKTYENYFLSMINPLIAKKNRQQKSNMRH